MKFQNEIFHLGQQTDENIILKFKITLNCQMKTYFFTIYLVG